MAGLLRSILGPGRRHERRGRVIAGVHPSASWSAQETIWGAGTTASGVDVNEWTAMQFSVVWACVNRIASDVGKIPLHMFRRGDDQSRSRETKHPLSRIVSRSPGGDQITAFQFRETLQAHMLLFGNAFAEIERTNAGAVLALHPLKPSRIRIECKDGAMRYHYRRGHGHEVPIPRENILHLRGLGYDGQVGYSVIRMAMESIGAAVAAERFGAHFFGHSAVPTTVLTHPGRLDDEDTVKRLRSSWKAMFGADGTEPLGVAVLEEGMKVERLTIPPEEAQFLETRQFMIPEICRWYGVPPHKVGDLSRATFSNIEQQDLAYLGDTLMSWLVRWQQQLHLALLKPEEQDLYFFEFDTNAFVRADVKARHEAYAIAKTNGWMNADEIRARENMNALPDGQGQIYTVQSNMTTPGAIGAAPAAPAAPAPPMPAADDQTADEAPKKKKRAALVEAATRATEALVIAAYRSLHRVEADRARRAIKRGEVPSLVSGFYAEHAEHVRSALMPIAETIVHIMVLELGERRVPLPAAVRTIADTCVARSVLTLAGPTAEAALADWESGVRANRDAAEDARSLVLAIASHWDTQEPSP